MRPLRVRPGARFECRGDGLCCADIHLWGPVSRREAQTLRLIAPDVLARRPNGGGLVLQATTDGRCVFWDGGCRLHAALGAMAKPATCRRFPFSLTATPTGGRVATTHRCTCRVMPSGPPLTPDSAEPSIVDSAGRLEAERRIATIALDTRTTIPFSEWERREASLLERLATEEPEDVVDDEPFALLDARAWHTLGEALAEPSPTTRYEAAVALVGDALLARFAGREPAVRPRPWTDAFDAAERMAPRRTAREVLADWIADDLWSLDWADGGTFALLRTVLAVRLALARDVAARLERLGTRPERAAAEAVLATELAGISDGWAHTARALANALQGVTRAEG